MAALRIAFAALLAALAGVAASWVGVGVFGVVRALQHGDPSFLDPVEMVRSLAILLVVGVPAALPLSAGAAVVALRLQRRGLHHVRPGSARDTMRSRFVLGCAAAGAVWEALAFMAVAGAVRAKPLGLGGAFGFLAGAAGGWVLWRWSQRMAPGRGDPTSRGHAA